METWLPIPGYDGRYKISNLGHVCARRADGEYFGRKLNAATPYLSFSVSNGRGKPQSTFYVHNLVAKLFIGSRPDGMVIRHLDGNRFNNKVENLQYGYPQENYNDAIIHGIRKGSNNGRSKLDEKDVKVIKALLDENVSLSIIARAFEVSVSAINQIHKQFAWKHV